MSGQSFNNNRIKLLAIILFGVALLHVIAIAIIYSSPKTAKEDSETLTAENIEKPRVKPEIKPQKLRFRKPSTNPNFGSAFDESNAVRGDMPTLPHGKDIRSGFMVDLNSRKVLWMKNETKPVPVASMVKMMTLLITFEALESTPKWNLQTPIKITAGATKVARTGIIWLDTRETMPFDELLKALTIKSANDAAYQVAEFVGNGDVGNFIARMNAKAAQLNMPSTKFVNPHGLPDKTLGNSLSSAKAMVILGERLLEYPDIMGWTSTQLTYIRGKKTQLVNTNGLVRPRYPGVDGLKTGYTRDAGFCSTVTAERDGRRLMVCVTGFKSAKFGRDPFLRKLLDWGFERTKELEK